MDLQVAAANRPSPIGGLSAAALAFFGLLTASGLALGQSDVLDVRSRHPFRSSLSLGLVGEASSDLAGDGASVSVRGALFPKDDPADESAHYGLDVEFWDLAGASGFADIGVADWRITYGYGRDWRSGQRLIDWRYTWDMGFLYHQADPPLVGVLAPRLASFGVCASFDPEIRLFATDDHLVTGFVGIRVGACLTETSDLDFYPSDMSSIGARFGLRSYASSWFAELAYTRRELSYGEVDYDSVLFGSATIPGPDLSLSGITLSVGLFW